MNKFRPRRPKGVALGKTRQRMLFDRLHGGSGSTPPSMATFVSASVPKGSDGSYILVVLSSADGSAEVKAEWSVKVGAAAKVATAVHGKTTKTYKITVGPAKTIIKGAVIKVSHLVEASGIKKFTDKAVTNSLV